MKALMAFASEIKHGKFQGAGGIGGPLARTTYGQELPGAPTTSFYHADGNGNVTAMMYPDQQLAAKYLYDPFGNMLAMSGPLRNLNKYRFSSKEWERNAGLYYYGYRFYDPSLQRWVNRDPIGEPGGLNIYAYAANSPIDLTDSWGLLDDDDPGEPGWPHPPDPNEPLGPIAATCYEIGRGIRAVLVWAKDQNWGQGPLPRAPRPFIPGPPQSGCSICPQNGPPIVPPIPDPNGPPPPHQWFHF